MEARRAEIISINADLSVRTRAASPRSKCLYLFGFRRKLVVSPDESAPEYAMLVLTDPTKSGSTETFPQKDFREGAKMLAGRVDPPTESAGALHKLLTLVVQVAVDDLENTYTEQDVAFAYRKLARQATARVQRWEADAAACESALADNENRRLASALSRAQRDQETRLADLEKSQYVVITRGTDPTQALNILIYQTFGGVLPGPERTDTPTEAEAGVQTGYGIKVTSQGRLEEWSLGTLEGFSTGGYMLIAAAKPTAVRLPPVKVRSAGESGVTGFADQRMLEVALLKPGPKSTGDPLERAIEGMLKQGQANAANALHDAVLHR
ncbi:hypothetical protein ACIP5Y_39860 [Nocardia sp. NPDC088792]|uniref:hypothetical protein n=1 Tax=Nocardia sp. NPDC088792 TaxID=3364332 RepID=UPI00382D5388